MQMMSYPLLPILRIYSQENTFLLVGKMWRNVTNVSQRRLQEKMHEHKVMGPIVMGNNFWLVKFYCTPTSLVALFAAVHELSLIRSRVIHRHVRPAYSVGRATYDSLFCAEHMISRTDGGGGGETGTVVAQIVKR